MGGVIRRALGSDAPALTRIAHAAKRHSKYPEDWIRTVRRGGGRYHPLWRLK